MSTRSRHGFRNADWRSPMASSGTTTFNLTVDDIIRRAYNRFGQTSPSGYKMRQGLVALNLILQDIGNRNVLLFTTGRAEFQTHQGVTGYVLPANTIDVQDVMISDGYLEIPLVPFSQGEYQRLPLKAM